MVSPIMVTDLIASLCVLNAILSCDRHARIGAAIMCSLAIGITTNITVNTITAAILNSRKGDKGTTVSGLIRTRIGNSRRMSNHRGWQ